jgi:hypothetical protein
MRTPARSVIPIEMIALALTACSGPPSVADDTSPGTPDSEQLQFDPGSDGRPHFGSSAARLSVL